MLLAHAELAHLGLYSYAYAHWGLKCPAYATLPVQTLGRLQMLDAVRAWRAEIDVDACVPRRYVPTESEVDESFDSIRTLRYQQPTPLDGKCAGLVLTAYNAGHSLGGAAWKLRSPSVGTLVMTVDWNHHRERHIDGTALLALGAAAPLAYAIGRPDVLITDMERGLHTNARRKDRDAALLDQVHRTLTSGHSVLVPVDSAARLLEVLVLLDQHWAFAYQHQRFPLCLVSHIGQEVVERARTLMEWMSREWANQVLGAPDKRRGGRNAKAQVPKSPLDFPGLRFFSSVEALHHAVTPSQVKVVLATPAALSHGLSRELLPEFACDPDALLLLLGRGTPHSLARTLWDRWNAAQTDQEAWRHGHVGTPVNVGGHLSYELRRRVPLSGDELRAHVEAQQARDAAQPKVAEHQLQREADDDDASQDSSSSDEEGADAARLTSTHDIAPEQMGASAAPLPGVGFDIYLRGHASRDDMHYRMFPFPERRKKVDGYGEAIDTGTWLARRRRLEAEQKEQLEPGKARAPRKQAAPVDVPTKCTSETLSLAVRCRVMYIDMQGLSDGRALTTLVPQLQPRRVILVNGTAATSDALHTALAAYELYTPCLGDTLAIGGLSDSYSVRLGDALMRRIHWRQMQDYNVVHLHVVPDYVADAEVPTLVPAQDEIRAQVAQAPSSLYVGDLRLPALKAYLARQHRIRADFAGEGVLVCSDKGERSVTVTKQGAGRIIVEGNLSTGLARVRQSVYDMVAQVNQ